MVATIFVRRMLARYRSPPLGALAVAWGAHVLDPSRPLPGLAASIAHCGGGFESATALTVLEEGRRLQVRARERGRSSSSCSTPPRRGS